MTFQAPPPDIPRYTTDNRTIDDLTTELAAFGLKIPGAPITDGEIHRVPVPSSKTNGDKAGWYAIATYENGLIYADYGDWRENKQHKWRSRDEKTFTAIELAAIKQQQDKVRAEREKLHADAAEDAKKIWEAAIPATDHPYLTTKGIQAHGTRIAKDGRLIVPVFIGDKGCSLQHIDNAGNKIFHKGGKTSGGSYQIPGNLQTAVIVEGFSTAASIAEATGFTVYCAFTAGNLEKVVAAAKPRHTHIIIAGDDDKGKEINTGRRAAEMAAAIHRCVVVFPTFSDESTNPTDFNDMARIDGPDAVKAAFANLQPVALSKRHKELRPITLKDLKKLPPRTMLVKGLLGVGEMSVFFGEPKCGKSFLVTHLGLAIATGQSWAGKKVKQCPVIYIVAEGKGGFAKRIEAHSKYYSEVDDAPFYPIPTRVNLLDPDVDVEPLIHWVKTYGAKLVIVDTLSRTMPGGKENSPEDMGSYIANCDRIREETDAHVLVIHHNPKNDKNTPRGHTSLFGAVDALVLVQKGETENTATLEASKDDEDGWGFTFKLEVVDVGVDEDGDPITSCAVVVSDKLPEKKERPLTGDMRMAKDALDEVLMSGGRIVKNRHGVPDNIKCADIEAWRQEFYARASDKPTAEARRQAFSRNSKALRDKGICGFRDDLVWMTNHGS